MGSDVTPRVLARCILSANSPEATRFSVPGLESRAINLLDDLVVPMFIDADRVLALWSPSDPLWVTFQAGLATGLGKPVSVVALDAEAPSKRSMLGFVESASTPKDVLSIGASEFRAARRVEFAHGRIFLCPREENDDHAVQKLLADRVGDREYRGLSERDAIAPAVDNVSWVITLHEVIGGDGFNLTPNLDAAFEAGRCYGATVHAGTTPRLQIIRVGSYHRSRRWSTLRRPRPMRSPRRT